MVRDLLFKIEGGQRAFETASTEDASMLGITPEVSGKHSVRAAVRPS
jgi:hypothetical protein